MRNNDWLKQELHIILNKYFSDVKISNPIEIKFGRDSKFRFGSIRLIRSTKGIKSIKGIGGILANSLLKTRGTRGTRNPFDTHINQPDRSVITITSMFKSEDIPVSVIRHTIAHELCHYAHGFSSTNKRLFKHPHHGGIVNAELERRGAHDLIFAYKIWLKEYRKKILAGRKIF